MVSVDPSAKLSSDIKPLGAQLICLIARNVQLEEAGVSLREGLLLHVRHKPQFMLVAEIAQVNRQSGAAPHEFEIPASLVRCHCFEASPEAANDLVIVGTIWIACN